MAFLCVGTRIRIRIDTTEKKVFFGISNPLQKHLIRQGHEFDRFKVSWDDRTILIKGIEMDVVETCLERILSNIGKKHMGGHIIHYEVEDLDVVEAEILERSVRREYEAKIEDLKAESSGKGVLGLDARAASEVLGVLKNLDTTLRFVGPTTSPKIGCCQSVNP